jgi:hypothetical protein
MAKKKPDHRDAEILLKLYDLRREAVMRQSRAALGQWMPKTYEDVLAITNMSHPHNAAWRQCSSYWEMAYGFARHGILNADLLAENGTEGLFLYAKVEPHLARLRKELSPTVLQNAEWMVRKSPVAKKRLELVKKRLAAVAAAAASTPAASKG